MSTRTPTITAEMTLAAEKILDTIGECMKVAPGELLGTSLAATSAQYLTCRILQSVYGLSVANSAEAVGVSRYVARQSEKLERKSIGPSRIGFVNVEAAWQVAEALSGCDRAKALLGSHDTPCVTCRKIMHRLMQSFFGMSQEEAGLISGQGYKGQPADEVNKTASARIASLNMEDLQCSSTM